MAHAVVCRQHIGEDYEMAHGDPLSEGRPTWEGKGRGVVSQANRFGPMGGVEKEFGVRVVDVGKGDGVV